MIKQVDPEVEKGIFNRLTEAQERLLSALENGEDVYVFRRPNGYSFSHYKDDTYAKVYTTITARSLINKGVCRVRLCDVEGSMCDCVGVLVMGGEFE